MLCPYCGHEMKEGSIRCDVRTAVIWQEKDKKRSFSDRLAGQGLLSGVEKGFFHQWIPAAYCRDCRKMILDSEVAGV